MKKISKSKAKKVFSKILTQISQLDSNDLDWQLRDLVSGVYLKHGRYRLKIKNDWGEFCYECVQIVKGKVVFYNTFRTNNKKQYYSYDGDLLNKQQLNKVQSYLFK